MNEFQKQLDWSSFCLEGSDLGSDNPTEETHQPTPEQR